MITRPLADRMRPKDFSQVYGDGKLFSEGGVFPKMIASGHIPNMIFYGPSGTGKTTAANILARAAGKTLHRLNATTASLADIKDVVADTKSLCGTEGVLLYLDEIQYFNKKQQQSLLEFIEDGRITLIASTTENPYFYVYSAIISRCAVFEFKYLPKNAVLSVLRNAIRFLEAELGKTFSFDDDALDVIASASSGDARRAINLLENVAALSDGSVTAADVKSFLPDIMGMAGFDASGDGHYDLLSAFQKSIRGSDPDAAIFYLAKLLAGGDLLSVCRRIQVIASEDIGLAYPQAASITHACVESAIRLGLPEASIPLSNAAIMLATAPKSNSANVAYERAAADIAAGKGAEFPRQLQNKHFDGDNSTEKGQNYKYPHDYANHYVRQQYLPDDIKDAHYYEYGENKTEQAAKAYWDLIKKNTK